MNIKSLLVFLRTTIIFCLLLLLIGVNQEALSGQEGHGGETVNIEGSPVLRDLVDNTVCDWVKADEFVSRITLFPEVLQSIEKVHWYLALAIKREVPKLVACLTRGEFKKILAEDQDGLTIIEMETKQVAIRINQMIFIDETLLEKLDEESKAFLFLHEIMHSFFPLGTSRRNGKLRSFISTIQRQWKSPDSMTQKHFALQMEMNSVAVTPTTEPFDGQKENILKAIDPQANEVERMVAAYKASYISAYLLYDDKITIDRFKEKHISRYENAVQKGKIDEIWEGILFTGFDVNEFIKREEIDGDIRRVDKVNLLIMAVEKGDLETIIKLSQLPSIRFDVERTTYEYQFGLPKPRWETSHSLITVALLHRQVAVAQWLLNRNDIFIPASIFRTAYDKDCFEIFKTLCDRTDVNQPFVIPPDSMLSVPVVGGLRESLECFMRKTGSRMTVTLLMLSVCDPAQLKYLQYLLTREDIEVNVQLPYGLTALHQAVLARNIDAVRELLKHPRINPFLKLNGGTSSFLCWEYVRGDFTPRELAEELDYEEIEKVLEEFEDSLDD